MFYTGLDPYTLKPVFVEKTPEGKALQRALLQYYEPRNAEKVVKALQLTHREDLIPLLVPAVGLYRTPQPEGTQHRKKCPRRCPGRPSAQPGRTRCAQLCARPQTQE